MRTHRLLFSLLQPNIPCSCLLNSGALTEKLIVCVRVRVFTRCVGVNTTATIIVWVALTIIVCVVIATGFMCYLSSTPSPQPPPSSVAKG